MTDHTLDLSVLETYFTEQSNPADFLKSLHNVMVHYICCGGKFKDYADLDMISEDIEFLSIFYDTVEKASK